MARVLPRPILCVGCMAVIFFGFFLIRQQMYDHDLEKRVGSLEGEVRRLHAQLAATDRGVKYECDQCEFDDMHVDMKALQVPAKLQARNFAENEPAAAPPPVSLKLNHLNKQGCSPQRATKFHGYDVCLGWAKGSHSASTVLPITLVTQLSMDRLPSLERLVDAWQAPISAAIYVASWSGEEAVLQRYLKRSEAACKWLTISIIFRRGMAETYLIQTLRNLAMNLAKGSSIFLLDVDFIPSPRLAERAVARVQLYAKERPGVKVAFVIPAFEPTDKRSPNAYLPADKATLIREREAGLIQPILHPLGEHASHITTNFPRWYATTVDYAIAYEVLFEPYIVATMPGIPLYDERFNEYGNDKCAHIYELAANKYQFVVVADGYIIHMGHSTAEWKGVQDHDKAWEEWGKFMDEIQARYGWRPETPPRLQREVELGYLPGEWMKPAVGVQ